MQQGQIQWLTFASPSAVRAFFEQIPPEAVRSYRLKVASVGPVTSKELIQFGVQVDVEATEHTIDGLLDAIESVERHASASCTENLQRTIRLAERGKLCRYAVSWSYPKSGSRPMPTATRRFTSPRA